MTEPTGILNDEQLQLAMAEWRNLMERAGVLQELIVKSTLALGQTQRGDGVQAVYNSGRKTYDYSRAGRKAHHDIIERHTTPETNWRLVCEEAGFTKAMIPFSESAPSVSLRVKE